MTSRFTEIFDLLLRKRERERDSHLQIHFPSSFDGPCLTWGLKLGAWNLAQVCHMGVPPRVCMNRKQRSGARAKHRCHVGGGHLNCWALQRRFGL